MPGAFLGDNRKGNMRVYKRSVVIALAAIFTLAFAPALLADQDVPGLPPAERLAAMQRFSQMVGLPVRNRQDHKLGKMEDLLLNLVSGHVLCALIKPAGGADDFLVAVPAESFLTADQNQALLETGKDHLQTAPHLPNGVDDDAALAKVVSDAYDHFHQQPTWTSASAPSGIIRASKLTGLPARSRAREDVGNLLDLMVDLPTARLVFGVLSLDGSEQTRYAVPPAILAMDPEKPGLLLNADKAKITTFAHKGKLLFQEITDPVRAAAIYRLYQQGNDDTATSIDPTRENVREKIESAPAPAIAPEAPPVMSDEAIKQHILTAIIRNDSDSVYSCKQLNILSVNGHVTLTGRAKNQKQKDALGALAEGVVGAGKVDNQIDVHK